MSEKGLVAFGFVGVGAIAAAMVEGLCRCGETAPSILLSPRSRARSAELARRYPTVTVAADNQAVADGAKVIVLCPRPQDAPEVLAEMQLPPDRHVISVMAGISLAELTDLGVPKGRAARSIPLPSVAKGAAITPVFPLTDAAQNLFGRLGAVEELPDETAFSALSASTSSIATHFRYLSLIATWLRGKGVPDHIVQRQIGSTFSGVARELTDQTAGSEDLARMYATPGGINAQFLQEMEKAGFSQQVNTALDAVLARLTSPNRPPS